MSEQNTGGTAFPVPSLIQNGQTQFGMTLRDYFAAKALQGMLAGGRTGDDYVAALAYRYADAMLKERKQ
ncbi:MAG TPA: hypothetical protein VLA24_14175 [Pseudomonadales bacterium]|nr:hypothetical protein [Pseudomonadales bacterium]